MNAQQFIAYLLPAVLVFGCAPDVADDDQNAESDSFAEFEPLTDCEPQWSTSVGQTGFNGWIYTMHVWDDGNGSELYAGGLFSTAGGRVANCIAKWDGYNWRPLGEGLNGQVMAITNFDDGHGDALYVGGLFSASGEVPVSNIAKWDPRNKTWSALGGGVDNAIIALAAYDGGDGPALYAGGSFQQADDVLNTEHIAKWDGENWSDVGGGADNIVRALLVFDKGDGSELYVGGLFDYAGDLPASRIARWDGEQWHALSGKFIGQGIRGMTVHDDGRGPGLFVVGVFPRIDNIVCNNLARWDPVTDEWTGMAGGVNERMVTALSFDDGTGHALYVVGWMTRVGRQSVNRIARWDGAQWSRVQGDDISKMVARGLAVYPDAETNRQALYVGGGFDGVNHLPTNNIAAWVGCRQAASLIPSDEPLGRIPTIEDEQPEGGRERGTRTAPRGDQPEAQPQPRGGRTRPSPR